MDTRSIMRTAPVIPVLVIDDAADAVALARALVDGGLPVLEVTLRTPAALAAIERIAAELPEAIVGVGTVRNAADLAASLRAGARFAVSPGLTPALAAAARDSELPLLPGVMTASEAMAAMEAGFDALKLFPAQQAGGIGMLKAIAGPFPELLFCPTGGISPENFRDFLAQPNVACVGGSWLAPRALVAAADWDAVRRLASEAAAAR
ncbi:bifunctional 4-hydroxy-2-oxoglutarate aldolase/2-dehydro-3-deoxy-phosphogluconate aldolase [Plasticicumulans acidivorans]|uniref:2-dehydro-3-deoxy-phosphogluconate aldolase n=1 Tax=Plasticicumulans acidivorans TaxID=886464 RepID=A0A317MYK3_9GAMM|nr:bifunctional 4-hydroxy-2-oxoglutarate aldolase/2-dehydro-3-deoxy-phosphogluconate aldolase [Plasticicumulans acidivorans]PWV64705.1 2-dehydro-3-deoxyphosphogluconate aldolase/(4S)-4-hydroxy-2-oxoglutarate aldolase [Plasticicumulans acidivorans]